MFLPAAPTSIQPRRRLVWVGIALGLVISGLGAHFGYGLLKQHQARRLIAQAGQLVAGQQWDQAHQKVLAALRLSPGDNEGLRLAARILTRFQNAEAFPYWERAFTAQKPSTEELLDVVGLTLATRRFELAEQYLREALQRTNVPLAIVRAAALFCAAKGDTAGTIRFASACLQHQPQDWDLRWLLARQLLSVASPEAQREGRAALWAVVQSDHSSAAQALVLLATLPDLTREEIQNALKRLEAYPAGDILRDLLAQDFKLKLEPQRRAELISATVRQYQSGSRRDVLLLARWLSDKGDHAQVTRIISQETALGDKDLFLVYGDALASQGAWTQLQTLLARERLPLEPVLIELYRARIAQELKKDRQAATHWAQAQWLAGDNSAALWYLAEYAERVGAGAEALKAYRRLTRDAASARRAFLALVRLAEASGDTAALRTLMKELVAHFPDDPAPRIDLAYLDLLAGENLAQAKVVAQRLYDQHPNMPAYRTTLALAHLRLKETAAAQALFNDSRVDWTTWMPGWQAVRTAALGASGSPDAARQLARQIRVESLKPEERALLKPWL